jgi:flagellar export protein FliJ
MDVLMKRQRFRLGSVLRYYEIRKRKAETELHQATRVLEQVDEEISRLERETNEVSELMRGPRGRALSMAGWVAGYVRVEHLGRLIVDARSRREMQAVAVEALKEQMKRWAIAEESLSSMRHAVDLHNHDEAAKAQQLTLDEAVLRRWLGLDPDAVVDT